MSSESAPSGSKETNGQPASLPDDFGELRELLVGPERRRLAAAEQRLAAGLTAQQLAEQLPQAIAIRSNRDRQLARSLAPTIEGAIRESVRRNPRDIAIAIFPVLGPAIRKAIAETMAGLVRSIDTALQHSLSLRGFRWRFEAWRTGVPYPQVVIKHTLLYRVEQVFLIHAETGLLLAHAAPPDRNVANADLVASMLTAIQDFVADSFATAGDGVRLRTFSAGDLTVMVELGPEAVLAAVVRGQPPDSLLAKLQDTLETIHLEFAPALAGFTGDAGPFAATAPLLQECLETVLTPTRRTAFRWAVPLLLLALAVAIGWFAWRADRRWRAAVGRLSSEPGIVVVRADRDWGEWRFAGLKDPIARDPKVVLAGTGADTAGIRASFEPYLSLVPAIVLERARRDLAPPAGIRLELIGDSLAARGQAPLAWLASVRRRAPPAGVSRLDLHGVTPILPDELVPLVREIESTRIFFPVESDRPWAPRQPLDRVAELLDRLSVGASKHGHRVAVQLIGRTDQSGPDSLNQALSQRRAEVVREWLLALGVRGVDLTASGVGGSDPLAGADPRDQAALNRTVSFTVRLASGDPD